MTKHSAFWPHDPGHGSLHFVSMQAKVLAHSELIVHSGRQEGGAPMKPSRQTHAATSPIALHFALGPHGSPKHGSTGLLSVVDKTTGRKFGNCNSQLR